MKGKIKLQTLQDQSLEPNRLIQSIPGTERGLSKVMHMKSNIIEANPNKLVPDQSFHTHHQNKNVSISLSLDESKNQNSNSRKDIIPLKTQGSNRLSKKQILQIEMEKYQNLIQNHFDRQKEKPKESWKKPNLFQNNALRQIVKKQKIQALVRNFISKIHRSNMYSQPVQFNQLEDQQSKSILYRKGIQLNQIFQNIFAFLSIIQILTLFFLYTLSLVYDQIANSQILNNLQSISAPFYILQMILNLITVKNSSGKKLTAIIDIWRYYYNHDFWVHFLSLLVLIINLIVNNQIISFIRLIIILKLPECLEKMQKLEVHFIKSFYNEQYWSLIKVFLFNFCFAHILAIFLAAMTSLNDQQNWMIRKGLEDANWYEKYIWSYYWGTTIMLTLGFGDLVATTYQQALCLIFIETFSCIVLAYNVSCVGTLISNIRSQDLEKSKNFKIFKKLADSNFVPEELTWKVNNYIKQTSNLKKKFNYQEQNQFIDKLPSGLKKQYLKESNKKIFQNLTFFKALVDKTLYNFAQKIEMHISHPQQIVRHLDDDYNLMILKVGELAYTCKKPGCGLNEKCVDFIKAQEGGQPKLTSLLFIEKKRPIYEIKSLEYSTLYVLDYQKFINILRQTEMDFELYALLRDKIKNIPDQFEVNRCELCKGRHFKFTCPKLHFIPYQQQVANRYIYLQRTQKSQRKMYERGVRSFLHPFIILKKIGKVSCKMSISIYSRKKKRNGMIQRSNSSISEASINQKTAENQVVKLLQQNQTHMKRMATQYESHAKQFIKNEFNKFFKAEAGEDEVWLLSLDRLKDFNGYFQTDNPSNLHIKYQVELRSNIEHKLKSLRQESLKLADSSVLDEIIEQ